MINSGIDDLNFSDRTHMPVLNDFSLQMDVNGDQCGAITLNQQAFRAKRQHGVYYTPLQVAELLVQWAIRSKHDQVLEPSFGGCAFLEASVNHLHKLGCISPKNQLSGFDIDPQAFVHLANLDKSFCENGNRFVKGDFLTSNVDQFSGQKVNAIVGNPPFVPYRRMNISQRNIIENWSQTHVSVVQKDASLWAYFLQHSLQFLKPGGRMAWVLPTSILFVQYGHALRELIQKHFQCTIYIDLQEQLFIDSGTRERTVLLFADGYSATSLKKSKFGTFRFSHFDEVESYFTKSKSFSKLQSRIFEEPLEKGAELISAVLAKIPYTPLGEISSILIGDVIGDTNYFVKNQAEWAMLGIRETELNPILTKSTQISGIRVTKAMIAKMIASGEKCLLLRPTSSILSKATEDYLNAYPLNIRSSNATFARRPVWYISTYDNTSDLFFPSISTIGSRIIVNSGKLACANAMYKVRLDAEWRVKKYAIALYGISSFAQLSVELIGCGMGEGALKLNPLHLKQLPVMQHLYDSNAGVYELFLKVDRLMTLGRLNAARKIADDWLAPFIGQEALVEISNVLEIIRARRRNYRREI